MIRRLLRFAAKAALVLLIMVAAFLAITFVIHRMQLSRLRRLAAMPPTEFVSDNSPYFVLRDVEVIDGTGAGPRFDQAIVVQNGKIAWMGNVADMRPQPGAKILKGNGATVIPGLVMMHEHLFTTYASPGLRLAQQSTVYPLLYLASGVTTARTAGSLDPQSDLRIKQRIDNDTVAGPELFLTAPYLEGRPALYPQMHALANPSEAKQAVDRYADQGFSSFKAYTDITPEELQAAIDEAHVRGAKITGHLCTITFTQAANMGIDDLEHGILVDTEFYSHKQPNTCPSVGPYLKEYRDKLDIDSPAVDTMIDHLIAHHVAVTSTLAVFEGELGDDVPDWYQQHEKAALTWRAWWLAKLQQRGSRKFFGDGLMRKAQAFDYRFAQHGGTLLAGADPTGDGSVLAGFADLREIELLVDAGFTPVQAIQIATQNGAKFLGIADRTGTIEIGKRADMILIDGDPVHDIHAIRNVRTVFRRGIGYDSHRMIAAVQGVAGLPD